MEFGVCPSVCTAFAENLRLPAVLVSSAAELCVTKSLVSQSIHSRTKRLIQVLARMHVAGTCCLYSSELLVC